MSYDFAPPSQRGRPRPPRVHHNTGSGHSVLAQSRMWGNSSTGVVGPKPEFGGVDLFSGGEHEGWLSVIDVPKDAMDEVILSYGKGLLGGAETWFALKLGKSVNSRASHNSQTGSDLKPPVASTN